MLSIVLFLFSCDILVHTFSRRSHNITKCLQSKPRHILLTLIYDYKSQTWLLIIFLWHCEDLNMTHTSPKRWNLIACILPMMVGTTMSKKIIPHWNFCDLSLVKNGELKNIIYEVHVALLMITILCTYYMWKYLYLFSSYCTYSYDVLTYIYEQT